MKKSSVSKYVSAYLLNSAVCGSTVKAQRNPAAKKLRCQVVPSLFNHRNIFNLTPAYLLQD